MNKDDMLLLADVIEELKTHYKDDEKIERLIKKINLIAQQIHLQDNIIKIKEEIDNLDQNKEN